MANYVASARSNYFRVRDEDAFLVWVETVPGVVAYRDTPLGVDADVQDHAHPSYTLLVEDYDAGGWPCYRTARSGNLEGHDEPEHAVADVYEDQELDLPAELAEHLAQGEVAVLEEVGAEKLRYLSAHAVAVNHRGEQIRLDLSEIYERVRRAGWEDAPSEAVY